MFRGLKAIWLKIFPEARSFTHKCEFTEPYKSEAVITLTYSDGEVEKWFTEFGVWWYKVGTGECAGSYTPKDRLLGRLHRDAKNLRKIEERGITLDDD